MFVAKRSAGVTPMKTEGDTSMHATQKLVELP